MVRGDPWTEMRSQANEMLHYDDKLDVAMDDEEALRTAMEVLEEEMHRVKDRVAKFRRKKKRSRKRIRVQQLIGLAPQQVEERESIYGDRRIAHRNLKHELATITNQFSVAEAAYNAHLLDLNGVREQRDDRRVELQGSMEAYTTLKCIKIMDSADISVIKMMKQRFPTKQIFFTIGESVPKLTVRAIKKAAARLGIQDMDKGVVHQFKDGVFTKLTEQQCRQMEF